MKRLVIALLPAFGLASCGSNSSSSTASAHATSTPAHMTLEERCNTKYGFKQDAHGNWKPRVDLRSPLESVGTSPYFKGNYQTKECKTPTLASKSWWGSKDYTTKAFSGNTTASALQKTSRADGLRSREDGTLSQAAGKTVRTNSFKTGTANETKRGEFGHPSDAQTDSTNRSYVQPAVIDWQQQRAMSMDETKNMLGR